MRRRWRIRDAMGPWFVWFLVSATIAVAGFIAYPGCATSPDRPSPPSPAVSDEWTGADAQRGLYNSAIGTLKKMKTKGELTGIEPTADGTFSGTWLWYDRTNKSDPELRVFFKYTDGRPGKRIEMTYANRWQVKSINTGNPARPNSTSVNAPMGRLNAPW